MLVSSIFCFSYDDFYSFADEFHYFTNYICRLQTFSIQTRPDFCRLLRRSAMVSASSSTFITCQRKLSLCPLFFDNFKASSMSFSNVLLYLVSVVLHDQHATLLDARRLFFALYAVISSPTLFHLYCSSHYNHSCISGFFHQ